MALLHLLFVLAVLATAQPLGDEVVRLTRLYGAGELSKPQFEILVRQAVLATQPVGVHRRSDGQGGASQVVERLLQTAGAPDGIAGSQLWLKGSSAKIVLGPEADTSIAREAPNRLATGELHLRGEIGTHLTLEDPADNTARWVVHTGVPGTGRGFFSVSRTGAGGDGTGAPLFRIANDGGARFTGLLTAGGGLKLSDVGAACTAALQGTLKFDAADKELRLCVDEEWVGVKPPPPPDPTSCIEVKAQAKPSGVYTFATSVGSIQVYCDNDSDGGGWTLVLAIINGQTSPSGTGPVSTSVLTTARPTSPGKFSDAAINALAVNDEYRYCCGPSYRRFFKLSHDYASAVAQVRAGDKCKVTHDGSWIDVSGGGSNTNFGLASTPNGDGCGTCVDRCGGGREEGFWHSWHEYYATTHNNGCFTHSGAGGTGYSNGWMYVR